jgi:hypothetical protein
MQEIKPDAEKLHERKFSSWRGPRIPPLISLVFAALVWTLAALGLIRSEPRPAAISSPGETQELTGGVTAAAKLTQAELDERAPISPQELGRFLPGKRHRTARAVYQATMLLTQGGARERYMGDVAALLGVCRRTVQRAHDLLEELELSRRRHVRAWAKWNPLTGVKTAWNLPNVFRFVVRARQLQIFFQNVTQSRNNLKTKSTTPKTSPSESGGMCKTRPDDHPDEVRAAYEARRRANHPPEMLERYKAKAELWNFMRGWRPRRRATIIERAAEVYVGTHFESEAQRIATVLACAVRLGLGERTAAKLRRELLAKLPPAPAPAISWAELDEPRELVVVATLQLRPRPQAAELEPQALDVVVVDGGGGGDLDESGPGTPQPVAAELPELPAQECRLCEGRRRRIVRSRIVVCKCSPGDW